MWSADLLPFMKRSDCEITQDAYCWPTSLMLMNSISHLQPHHLSSFDISIAGYELPDLLFLIVDGNFCTPCWIFMNISLWYTCTHLGSVSSWIEVPGEISFQRNSEDFCKSLLCLWIFNHICFYCCGNIIELCRINQSGRRAPSDGSLTLTTDVVCGSAK